MVQTTATTTLDTGPNLILLAQQTFQVKLQDQLQTEATGVIKKVVHALSLVSFIRSALAEPFASGPWCVAEVLVLSWLRTSTTMLVQKVQVRRRSPLDMFEANMTKGHRV